MGTEKSRELAEEYVYYRRGHCAGLLRRMVAIVVDLLVLALGWIAAGLVLDGLGVVSLGSEQVPAWYLPSLLGATFLYLTLLKRSWIRTPGYWVTDLRIVDLEGRPPSMFRMTLRLLWWVLGPINPLLDLLFLSSDDQRQTLRDKLIGTYVVRRYARPAGTGTPGMGTMSFMGMRLLFPMVKPVEPSDAEGVT